MAKYSIHTKSSVEKELRLTQYEPVKLIDKTPESKTKDIKEEKSELNRGESPPKPSTSV